MGRCLKASKKAGIDIMQDEISRLKDRISTLELENRLLKERLLAAGISYDDIVDEEEEDLEAFYDPNQGARIKPIKNDGTTDRHPMAATLFQFSQGLPKAPRSDRMLQLN